MKIRGGAPLYSQAIGILLLDSKIPRIPGDIGNASTFAFPVHYKVVRNVNIHNVRQGLAAEEIEKFCAAARELEQEGCRAITTSCGFLGAYQPQLAAAVNIPVYTSSLLQAGWIASLLPDGKRIGVISSDKANVTPALLRALKIESLPLVVAGLDGSPCFAGMHGDDPYLDPDMLRQETLDAAKQLLAEAPDIGAILLECTNLPPYALDIQELTALPVFDIVTLTHYVYHAVVQTGYSHPKQRL